MAVSLHSLVVQNVREFTAKATHFQLASIGVFSAVFLYFSFTFIRRTYRLHFHPLAKFPGPREAAVSTQWLFEQHKQGYPEYALEALHKEYKSNVLRIGPNELHITDPLLYKQIYSQANPFPKDIDFYSTFQTPRTLFAETIPSLHKECRKALNPLFSRQGVLKLEPFITQSANELSEKIRRLAKKGPVNVVGAFKCVTVDVISQFSFGRSLNLLHESEDSFDAEWLTHTNEIGLLLWPILFKPALSLLTKIVPLKVVAALDKNVMGTVYAINFAKDSLREYKKRPANVDHPVIFDHLKYLPDDAQALEAVDILVAGADTTAYTLCVAILNLSQHQDVKQKLVSALKEAIPDPNEIPGLMELEKITYLYAIIKESIRIASPVPGRLPRIVQPAKMPLIVEGMVVPVGTKVGMSAYCMNRDTSIWGDDAHLFRPERWLEEGGKGLNDQLFSFSKGARNCIGINVAHAELWIVLARLYRQFDIHSDEKELVSMDWFNTVVASHTMMTEFKEVQE